MNDLSNSDSYEKDKLTNPSESINKNIIWKRLLYYFGLTYAITWTCWILAMIFLTLGNYPIPSNLTFFSLLDNEEMSIEQFWLTILFNIGTYGPFISAVCILLVFYDKDQIRNYFRRFVHFKVDLKWYLYIILIPVVQTIIYMLLNFINPPQEGSFIQFNYPWYYLFLLFINQTLSSGLEEPGWRGFATPEMQKVKNAEDSGYFIGIFWAIWHFPFLIVLYSELYAGAVWLIILSLVGYIALTIPMAIIMVWLYNNTQSIGLMIIFHGLLNTLPMLVTGTQPNSINAIVIAVVAWLFAGYLSKKFGKETLTAT